MTLREYRRLRAYLIVLTLKTRYTHSMRLQLRLLLVMVMALLAMAGILVLQHQIELGRMRTVVQNETDQRHTYFKAILSIDQQPLETLARDYSFWDQMVDFVSSRNHAFATDNIDTSLSTFKIDVAWVYNLQNQLVYASQIDPAHPIAPLSLSTGLTDALKKDKFAHFYVNDNGTLIEVRMATIVPSDDPNHVKPAAGYWIVARRIDAGYMAKLANLSQSSDSLLDKTSKDLMTAGPAQISFTTDLNGPDGSAIKVLKTVYDVPIVTALNTSYLQQLVQVGVFGTVLISIVTGVLWVWVVRPIRKISHSITVRQPALLNDLSHSHAELGRLASTVQEFFQQKDTIAEDAIRRADLENLNREKTVFLSMAAHELKGPISIVHMITGDLPQVADRLSPAELATELETVTRQTTKMAMIISDLQSASQGESNNKIEYRPTLVDFDSFLKQELKANQLITSQKLLLSGETHASIFIDPMRMSQVVSNLIRNASKYAPGTDTIEIMTEAHEATVSFSVRDHGIGIPADEQDKIFHRFYRAQNAAEHFQGMGIGLSVCYQIVHEFGGKIVVQSELDHGSTFTVELKAVK